MVVEVVRVLLVLKKKVEMMKVILITMQTLRRVQEMIFQISMRMKIRIILVVNMTMVILRIVVVFQVPLMMALLNLMIFFLCSKTIVDKIVLNLTRLTTLSSVQNYGLLNFFWAKGYLKQTPIWNKGRPKTDLYPNVDLYPKSLLIAPMREALWK